MVQRYDFFPKNRLWADFKFSLTAETSSNLCTLRSHLPVKSPAQAAVTDQVNNSTDKKEAGSKQIQNAHSYLAEHKPLHTGKTHKS